jgi:hypothetical protein
LATTAQPDAVDAGHFDAILDTGARPFRACYFLIGNRDDLRPSVVNLAYVLLCVSNQLTPFHPIGVCLAYQRLLH